MRWKWANDDNQTDKTDGEEKLYRYIQVMCIDCLLTIYKLNKPNNNTSSSSSTSHYHLDQSMFNIELLIQMLHVNRSDGGGDEPENAVERTASMYRIASCCCRARCRRIFQLLAVSVHMYLVANYKFNPTTTMINCAFFIACVLITNTPFWVKKDPHRCSKVKMAY